MINVANRTLFEGDNLPVLRGINSESIDLIATDPPFNKGRDFHATPDSLAKGANFKDRWSWQRDVHQDWVDSIVDEEPAAWAVIDWTRMSYGDDMGAFLCFIGVRLLEMRRVLKPTGSIYLHCDPTASHYLKALMDAVFGRAQFRNEIVWQRTKGRSDAGQFGRVHDVILYYTRGGDATWNQPLAQHDPAYAERAYRHEDERGRWQSADLTASGRRYGESGEPWRGIDPSERGRHWSTPVNGGMTEFIRDRKIIAGWPERYPSVHERLDALDAAGLIHWSKKDDAMPRLKRYLASTRGTAIDSIWTDIGKLESAAKEKIGYPTQKPLALYDRIIRASSNEGDWVLDPFAGCATTSIAAELAGRNWIGIDLWDGTHDITKQRLADAAKLAGGSVLGLFGEPILRTDIPLRTDAGEVAAAYLATPTKAKPRPRLMPESEIKSRLIDQFGLHCWGCAFVAPTPRYLELDHVRPKSAGGADDIDNRALLCGPCNQDKSAGLTLPALRKANGVKTHPISLKSTAEWTRQAMHDALEAKRRY